MLKKIVVVQCATGKQLALDENLLIFKQRPSFVVLPEYFNVNPARRDTERNTVEGHEWLRYCRTLSERFETILIAGTAVESDGERFFNTSIVFNNGERIGSYRKQNPTVNERNHNITPGTEPTIIEVGGVRISILICADVLKPENFERLRSLDPDIVFIPTVSPFIPNETIKEKYARDEKLFVEGSRVSGAYCVKCCGVGELWGGRLQGRSLVSAPWGIMQRVSPENEDKTRIFSVVLDISEIREFREKQRLVR
ncbi:MAG: carbon-nitrogen hydrolase family protein [Candidatus Zixiibacteriota bacterium]